MSGSIERRTVSEKVQFRNFLNKRLWQEVYDVLVNLKPALSRDQR